MSSTNARNESEDLLDLGSAFQHPAGLRTARLIVRSLLRSSPDETKSADVFSSVSPRFLGIEEPSSEVANILRDILAFSDSRDQMVVGTSTAKQVARPPRNESSRFTLADRNNKDVLQNRYTSSRPHNSIQTHDSNTFNVNNDLRTSGLDSPYRVESPFSHNSDHSGYQPSSHPPSSSASPLSLLGQRLDLPEVDRLARLEPSYAVADCVSNNWARHRSMGNMSNLQASSLSSRPSMLQRTPSMGNAPRFLPKESNTTIKSFMAVNKSGEGITVNPAKAKEPSTHFQHSPQPSQIFTPENRLILPQRTPSTARLLSNKAHRSTIIAPAPSLETSVEPCRQGNMEALKKMTVPRKRRSKGEDGVLAKRKQTEKDGQPKPKRVKKTKEPKPEPAKYKLDQNLWMRILEFTPPPFLRKARLISKTFKAMIDQYQSIYVNQRVENFGSVMPEPPPGITERQYNNLLGGKGCMEPGCDDKQASRTHWSWATRWCQACWKKKIGREDKLQKEYQNQLTRNVITKLLECIPVGMHDSFMKPHDYLEDADSRPRGAPRLYRYHLVEDAERIVREYESLKAPPFKENPAHSAAEKAAALAEYQALESEFVTKRAEFLDKRKAENDVHMERVIKIESAIRTRRQENAKPYDANRNARKELFTKGALRELPDIPIEFVKRCAPFKAAVRIFRDPGSERGWQTLKPKIQAAWDQSEEKKEHARKKAFDADVGESDADNSIADTPGDDELSDVSGRNTPMDAQTGLGQHRALSLTPLPVEMMLSQQRTHYAQSQMLNAQQHQNVLNSYRLNSGSQFSLPNFYAGPSAFQSFQAPNGAFAAQFLNSSHSFQHQNDMSTGNSFTSGLSMSSSFPSNYASFSMANNGSNSQSDSTSQASTHIPINSLLNGPNPSAGSGYGWTMN